MVDPVSVRPGLVRDGSSNVTKRNFPSDDHVGLQYPAHTRRGALPSSGIATTEGKSLSESLATAAMTHRPLGEAFWNSTIEYESTFVRCAPS
jgi:hypothetical protein